MYAYLSRLLFETNFLNSMTTFLNSTNFILDSFIVLFMSSRLYLSSSSNSVKKGDAKCVQMNSIRFQQVWSFLDLNLRYSKVPLSARSLLILYFCGIQRSYFIKCMLKREGIFLNKIVGVYHSRCSFFSFAVFLRGL